MQTGSILTRKLKRDSGRNSTTLDSEFEGEKQELEARKLRRLLLKEQRRVALFGSSQERMALKQKLSEDANFQLVIKEQREREQRLREQRENAVMEEYRLAMLELEQNRERERRERLRQVQEENRLAALAKASESVHRKVVEDRRDSEAILERVNEFRPNVF